MGSQSISFESLKAGISKGKVLIPESEGYEESLKRWSEASVRRAAVVVKPTNAAEVSFAVKFATASKFPLAVHCGGHSSKGASSSEGLVIDMSLMRSVAVNPNEKTALIDGGCLIRDVNKATAAHDLAVVTGVEDTVGYAGITLGGGYGYLTGAHGLGCDNLIEVEVVLADGSIVTASETENTDLFWALRGAGANFGVCTKFKARLYPQGSAWMGFLVFMPDQLSGIIDFVNSIHKNHSEKTCLIFGVTVMPPAFSPVITVLVFYNGTKEEGSEYFKDLIDLGPVADTTRYASWLELSGMPAGLSGKRKLHGSANFTLLLKVENVQEAIDELMGFLIEKDIAKYGSFAAWEFYPMEKVRELGATATAFTARNESYLTATILQWDDAGMDEEVHDFNERFSKLLKKTGVGEGVQQYNNYNGNKLSPEELFGENLPKLQELKKKYDPENVFSSWQNIFPV